MPRYKNCPTCGTICSYLSDNFAKANILTPMNIPLEQLRKEVEKLHTELIRMAYENSEKNSSLNNYTSDELFRLYIQKLIIESMNKQLKFPHFRFDFSDNLGW